jgi:hypothetical protein
MLRNEKTRIKEVFEKFKKNCQPDPRIYKNLIKATFKTEKHFARRALKNKKDAFDKWESLKNQAKFKVFADKDFAKKIKLHGITK